MLSMIIIDQQQAIMNSLQRDASFAVVLVKSDRRRTFWLADFPSKIGGQRIKHLHSYIVAWQYRS